MVLIYYFYLPYCIKNVGSGWLKIGDFWWKNENGWKGID